MALNRRDELKGEEKWHPRNPPYDVDSIDETKGLLTYHDDDDDETISIGRRTEGAEAAAIAAAATDEANEVFRPKNVDDRTLSASQGSSSPCNPSAPVPSVTTSHFTVLQQWIQHLNDTFSFSFLMLISFIYCVQGFNSFSRLAVRYMYKDEFHLEPSETQAWTTTMNIPWGIKPLYGILSDSLPLFGYHRKSYLFLFSVLSIAAYVLLATPAFANGPFVATSLLLITNLSTAFNDVVIDARIVEMARKDPVHGSHDLQTVSWSFMSLGGVLGAFLAGPVTDSYGPRFVFALATIGPVGIMFMSYIMHDAKVSRSTSSSASSASAAGSAGSAASVNADADATRVHYPRRFPRFQQCMSKAHAQWLMLLTALRRPWVWRSILYIFLSGSISPTFDSVGFYFATEVLKFSPQFLGFLSGVGYLFLMLGTCIYNASFKSLSFQQMFFYSQIAASVISLLDLILVTRLNLKWGISDKVFVFADEVVSDVISRLQMMPLLVLSAKICPVGIEGTLFALIMSVSNFSYSVSSYLGAFWCHILHISKDNYDNYWIAIVVRSAFKLIPVYFLFLLPSSEQDFAQAVPTTPRAVSLDKKKNSSDRCQYPLSPDGHRSSPSVGGMIEMKQGKVFTNKDDDDKDDLKTTI